MKRSNENQEKIDQKTQKYSLYQFHTCPFCVKVRRAIRKLNLNIALKDAKDSVLGDELLSQGGKRKVPCLKIETNDGATWLYESNDIIAFLQKEFS